MLPSGCRCLQTALDIPHMFCLILVAQGHFKFLPQRGYTKNQEITSTQTSSAYGPRYSSKMGRYHKDTEVSLSAL